MKTWEGSPLHSGNEAQNYFSIYLLGSDNQTSLNSQQNLNKLKAWLLLFIAILLKNLVLLQKNYCPINDYLGQENN